MEFLPFYVGVTIDSCKRQDGVIPKDGTGREECGEEYYEQEIFHFTYLL